MSFCGNCGNQVVDDRKFCAACGAAVHAQPLASLMVVFAEGIIGMAKGFTGTAKEMPVNGRFRIITSI